jgi:hypothetical protein
MSNKPTTVPQRTGDEDLVTEGQYAWCFAEGCGLPVGRWLSTFDVFAWMEFGGDYAKAEDHLRKVGYGHGQEPIVPLRTGCG